MGVDSGVRGGQADGQAGNQRHAVRIGVSWDYKPYPWANRAIRLVVPGRQPEHRHDVVAALHADFLDQRVDQGLAQRQRPVSPTAELMRFHDVTVEPS
jgi:hypothetical protein